MLCYAKSYGMMV